MNKLDKRFVQKFYARAGASIHAYDMIQANDRILVGVSGGKDSLALLQTLAGRRKFSDIKYHLIAVHINVEEVPYKVNTEWLKDFCRQLDVPLHIENIHVDFTQFYCSWNRRKQLFEITKKLNVNKLALGHHKDDALETLMLNMISHGTLSSMPGKLKMFDITNDECIKFSHIHQYPLEKAKCPHENATRRFEMRELLNGIEKQFPAAKKNIYKSLSQIYLDYLPNPNKEDAIIRDKRTLD